jgi:hypothetical protein
MVPQQLQSENSTAIVAEIWTEGKTDWRLLRRALEVLDFGLALDFHESDKDMGGDRLLKYLQTYADRANPIPLIFVFDHDQKDIVTQVTGTSSAFKDWGNNVFSFAIPIPSHRMRYENISIEMFFTDEELQRRDNEGRQLFLTSSFYENSGKHRFDPTIHCARVGFLKGCTSPEKAKILDSEVFDGRNRNIALSKSDFAEQVVGAVPPFDDISFEKFRSIFDIIEQIVWLTTPRRNLYYPDWTSTFSADDARETPDQFGFVLNSIANVISLALEIYIAAIFAVYRTEIVDEPEAYRKRVLPIKEIITERSRRPRLATLATLASRCSRLVNHRSPQALLAMRSCLEQTVPLTHLGQIWDDLETLFTGISRRTKEVGRSETRGSFLDRFVVEFAGYADKPSETLEDILADVLSTPSVRIDSWKNGLKEVVDLLRPVFSYPVVVYRPWRADPISHQPMVEVLTYHENGVDRTFEQETQYGDKEGQSPPYLILQSGLRVSLFPWLIMRDGALAFYRCTTFSGYEYYSVTVDRSYIEPTRRKFSDTLLSPGSSRGIAVGGRMPLRNPTNHILADIPDEGNGPFVGRRAQINRIKREIIEVANEHGIISGASGIGKTSLMTRLVRELYEEKNPDKILFDNILWLSGKDISRDATLTVTGSPDSQARGLDGIMLGILRFFGVQDLEEYGLEDRREFALDLLHESKILVVLDDLDVLGSGQATRIIDFFGAEVKSLLRREAENCKIILITNEAVPPRLSHIELKGLDPRDAKRFIYDWFVSTGRDGSELTGKQQEQLCECTHGIPVVIEHCLHRVYQGGERFATVVWSMSHESPDLIQDSYGLILQQYFGEVMQPAWQILALLHLASVQLSLEQIAEVLPANHDDMKDELTRLEAFRCISSVAQGDQEEYDLCDAARPQITRLLQDHRNDLRAIRRRYCSLLSFESLTRQSAEEVKAAQNFDEYVKCRQYAEAESFIGKELRKRPSSILLNFRYARYLLEQHKEPDRAQKIFEMLRGATADHPAILRSLLACYSVTRPPSVSGINDPISDIRSGLDDFLDEDTDLRMALAACYIHWSMSIKATRGGDTFDENMRQARYKNYAEKALELLLPIESQLTRVRVDDVAAQLHEVYYRTAQCYCNLWDYGRALKAIDRAVAMAAQAGILPAIDEYTRFRKNIITKSSFYARNPGLDQRR